MEVGIVGLQGVGKTSLFNALTAGAHVTAAAANKPNVGVVQVPDERLRHINTLIETERLVPATVKVTDIAGVNKGSGKGEGMGGKFLAYIREVDAVLEVVRCFESADVPHVDGSVDPVRDIDTVQTELVFGDLETLTRNLEKQRKHARAGDKDSLAAIATIEAAIPHLERGVPIRQMPLKPEQFKFLRTLGLLSDKKVLYIANIGEDDLDGSGTLAAALRQRVAAEGGAVLPVCTKLESELAELSPADRAEMLQGLGMKDPALSTVMRETYRLLGLQSFFTVGPDEIRAWTIPVGATAPQAAGAIHTDIEKGFIRAELYTYADLMTYKSEAAIKAAGKMRSEGKTYVMQEGDIVHFLFNG
jgi:ribosome-binding ATPase